MNMAGQTSRTWIVCGLVAAVAVTALGWFAVIGPQLSRTSSLKSQTTDVQLQNTVLQGKVSKLKALESTRTSLTSQLSKEQSSLPGDSGLPAYTYQLTRQAALAHVTLGSISAGAPTPVTAAGTSTAPITGATEAGQLFEIPISLTSTGNLLQLQNFLAELQKAGPRRSLVNSAQFSAGAAGSSPASGSTVTLTMQADVFVSPQTPDQQARLKKQLAVTTAG